MPLSAHDLGWIAGFLEGEGSFRFHRSRKGSGATPEVSAPQVQRDPLDRLKNLCGGSIYWRPTKGNGIYTWQVCGLAASGLMMTLYPSLSPKRREQIRVALSSWRAAPGKGIRNRSKTHCPQDHPYDETNTIRRHGGKHRQCRVCWTESWNRHRVQYLKSAAQRRRALRLLSRTAQALLSA